MQKISKIASISVLLMPMFVMAATTITSLIGQIRDILNAVVPFFLAIAVVYFLWGAVTYVMAGDDTKREESRQRIIHGLIGIFVMIAFWGLVNVLISSFSLDKTTPTDLPTLPSSRQ